MKISLNNACRRHEQKRYINTVHKSHLSNKLIELPSYQLFHYVNQFEIKKNKTHDNVDKFGNSIIFTEF